VDPGSPETVLVLAPIGRDAALTQEILAEAGIEAAACTGVRDLCARMQRGAGCALISEEALDRESRREIAATLAMQPPWSDFPMVVFSARGGTGLPPPADDLGYVTFLDRPVQIRTMIAAVRTALRARRHQYQARRAIESRDQFLAMLGHELRNPLGAIRLALELAARSGLRIEEREAKVIDRQSRHLARLVDDLLDVARVNTGKITLRSEAIDLGEVVRSAHSAVAPAAAAQQLTISLAEVPDEPIPVRGDRLRLEQIFLNVLGNALKYTPHGGVVEVRIATARNRVRVSVTDTGIGISPEMLPHVFEMFAQADRTLDRAQGGLGIGLTVARTLARLHGGDIEVESEGAGRGSTFHVTLPLDVAAGARAAAPSTVPPPPAAMRIVIVEDNVDLRDMLQQLLELRGHAIETAGDGRAGLDAITRHPPDAALIDLGLPGIDGYEVARAIRAAGLADVLLVAVSGYGQPDDRTRAAAAGFDAHLTKPVDASAIESVLARAKRAA
jgi:signal transduction histidine kinase